MKVAFNSRLLTERGSEGAMLDYARMNRSILQNDSIICMPDRVEFARIRCFENGGRSFQ